MNNQTLARPLVLTCSSEPVEARCGQNTAACPRGKRPQVVQPLPHGCELRSQSPANDNKRDQNPENHFGFVAQCALVAEAISPTQATRPTRSYDCNQSAMAGLECSTLGRGVIYFSTDASATLLATWLDPHQALDLPPNQRRPRQMCRESSGQRNTTAGSYPQYRAEMDFDPSESSHQSDGLLVLPCP